MKEFWGKRNGLVRCHEWRKENGLLNVSFISSTFMNKYIGADLLVNDFREKENLMYFDIFSDKNKQ